MNTDLTYRNYFTYAGKSCKEYGVWISGSDVFKSPSRDFEEITIPGRNGTLTISNNRYNNVTVSYQAAIVKDFDTRIEGLRNFMMTREGYQRLEDTYHPQEYRLAIFAGPIEPEMTDHLRRGSFSLDFNCKPQRFLKSGEYPQIFTASSSIYNSYFTTALPLIRVWGTGKLTVGKTSVVINSNGSYTDIDCDLQMAYCGDVSCDSNISLPDVDFPSLAPGGNTIAFDSTITRVDIYPRWYIL